MIVYQRGGRGEPGGVGTGEGKRGRWGGVCVSCISNMIK